MNDDQDMGYQDYQDWQHLFNFALSVKPYWVNVYNRLRQQYLLLLRDREILERIAYEQFPDYIQDGVNKSPIELIREKYAEKDEDNV